MKSTEEGGGVSVSKDFMKLIIWLFGNLHTDVLAQNDILVLRIRMYMIPFAKLCSS